jgi:hypothetical protein
MGTVCRCENRKIDECPVNKLFRPSLLLNDSTNDRHSRHPMPVCNLFGFLAVSCRSDFPSVAGFFVHRGACSIRFRRQARADPNWFSGVTHFGVAIPAKPSFEQFRARRLAQPSRDSREKVSFVPINGNGFKMTVS